MSRCGTQRCATAGPKHHPDCQELPQKAYQHGSVGPTPRDFGDTLRVFNKSPNAYSSLENTAGGAREIQVNAAQSFVSGGIRLAGTNAAEVSDASKANTAERQRRNLKLAGSDVRRGLARGVSLPVIMPALCLKTVPSEGGLSLTISQQVHVGSGGNEAI